jgi:predicted HTH domain antitoxin
MEVTISVPPEAARRLLGDTPDLGRQLLEGFAINAFREGRLSSSEVAALLGFTERSEAVRLLEKRGVYPGYDVEDFEQDVQTLQAMRAGCNCLGHRPPKLPRAD